VELVPFGAYARAGLSAVMTAHVVFEAVEPGVPATMSQRAMSILRRELGFCGVVVSDDLEMKAIADHYPPEEAAILGALAGVDAFLVCHRADAQRRAIEGLVKAVEKGRVPRERILEANHRIESVAGGRLRGFRGSARPHRSALLSTPSLLPAAAPGFSQPPLGCRTALGAHGLQTSASGSLLGER
jgi:beta-glucosidase-like glycosyl hydrolase